MKIRKTYDPDFKEKAVALCALRDSIKQVAEELGLQPDLLRRWRSKELREMKMEFQVWLSGGNCNRWAENEKLMEAQGYTMS
jgi:transposase-like protein